MWLALCGNLRYIFYTSLYYTYLFYHQFGRCKSLNVHCTSILTEHLFFTKNPMKLLASPKNASTWSYKQMKLLYIGLDSIKTKHHNHKRLEVCMFANELYHDQIEPRTLSRWETWVGMSVKNSHPLDYQKYRLFPATKVTNFKHLYLYFEISVLVVSSLRLNE